MKSKLTPLEALAGFLSAEIIRLGGRPFSRDTIQEYEYTLELIKKIPAADVREFNAGFSAGRIVPHQILGELRKYFRSHPELL